jgi:4-amino-4-deoxy-L-arabinose transferase-like glycosyltransferase
VARGQRLSAAARGWLAAGAAALAAAALLLPGLGAAPFDDPGEGQHAEIAREVAAGNEWVTLRLNGVRYFDKPPLLYRLTAASFQLFGASERAARLPPLLGTVLAVAATALFGARLLGAGGGLVAAGALLSSTLFFAFGRYLRPETLFVAAIQWGFTGLLLGLRAVPAATRTGSTWTLVGCAALGVAALVKDPLGLIGPLAAVGLALALAGRARPLSAWLPWGAVGVLVAVGFGWYVVAALRNAGFLWYTVVDNHLLNALRLRRFPDEDIPLSAVEFLTVSGLGAFPWIIPAALAMVSLARRRAWRDPSETAWVALALWVVGVFVIFAVMPFKLPHYALPAYPAIALLAARGWQERFARASGLIGAHALLLALMAAGSVVTVASDGKGFADLVFSATDVYARKEAAHGEAGFLPPWATLRPLIVRAGFICGLTSVALVPALVRRNGRLGLAVVTVGMLALMPSVEAGRDLVASRRAVAAMAREVGREVGPGDVLVHEGPIENSGALEFYSGRRPALLDGRQSVLGFGATFPDAREMFWNAERFRREWLRGGQRLLLVTPRSPASSVIASLPSGSTRLLFHDNGRWLYDNETQRGVSAPVRRLAPDAARAAGRPRTGSRASEPSDAHIAPVVSGREAR